MALWNSGAQWNSGQLWGPAATPDPDPNNTQTQINRIMKRQPFYPKPKGQRPEWHLNLATKVPGYASILPLSTAEVNDAVADNLVLAYSRGEWIVGVRDYAPACTAALDMLESGTGTALFTFPTFTPPALPELPAGILGVKPGALDRVFLFVQYLKTRPGYTLAIGIDLGIVGAEETEPPPGDTPPPRLTVSAIAGDEHERARLKFYKDGHEYVQFQSRRGGGGWEDIGMSDKSPYIDDRPLLVATQAEVREYRARFFDHGQPTGDWCDVAKVTVSP